MSAWRVLQLLLIAPRVSARCLPSLVNGQNYSWLGQGFALTLEQNDWLGAAVSTRTAALLLEEVLGCAGQSRSHDLFHCEPSAHTIDACRFDVTVREIPMVWSDPLNNPLSRLRDGLIDVNFEGWRADWPGAAIDEYTVTNQTVNKQAYGDFKGRVGFYVPRQVVQENSALYMDYWRPYLSREVKDKFVYPNATFLDEKLTEWAPNCGAGYGCEGTSRWQPEHCRLPGADCVPVFHVTPDYTVGWIEQLITNLQLNFSVYYAGWDIYQVVRDAASANWPILFYSWSPHEFLAANRYVRITFPEETQVCRNKDTNSRFGGRDCDVAAEDIYKFSNAALSERSLVAAKFVEVFELGLEDEETMLANLAAGGEGGTLTTQESVCHWATTVREGNTGSVGYDQQPFRWEEWVENVASSFATIPSCDEIASVAAILKYPTRYHADLAACFESEEQGSRVPTTLLALIAGLNGLAVLAVWLYRKLDEIAKSFGVQRRALVVGWLRRTSLYTGLVQLLSGRALLRLLSRSYRGLRVEDARTRWVASVIHATFPLLEQKSEHAGVSRKRPKRLRRLLAAVNTLPKRQPLAKHLQGDAVVPVSRLPQLLQELAYDLPHFHDLFKKVSPSEPTALILSDLADVCVLPTQRPPRRSRPTAHTASCSVRERRPRHERGRLPPF